MTVIDSHLHVWDLDRADYPWLGPHLAPIDVSLGLDDVRADLRFTGVDGVVLVQAADNAEDTATMFAVADAAAEVVGVVAWAPLDDPEVTAFVTGPVSPTGSSRGGAALPATGRRLCHADRRSAGRTSGARQ